jgi:type IV pilus assembly protein PilA
MKNRNLDFHFRTTTEEKSKLQQAASKEHKTAAAFVRDAINKTIETKKLGFTLIELIVTVIIIGILAGIATPVFLNQRKAAWKASVISDVSNAQMTTESATASTLGSIESLTFKTGTHDSPLLITAGSDTYKSTVSPDNTVTEVLGKTTAGEACYIITGINKHLTGYEYTKTSNGDDCEESSPNKLVGGVGVFYSLQTDGSMKKITNDGLEKVSAWSGLLEGNVTANALGISSNGMKAYAIARSSDGHDVAAVLAYDARTDVWSSIPNSAFKTGLAGSIVSGEVDADGNFLYGGYEMSDGQYVLKLFEYDSAKNTSYAIGSANTGITSGRANGDFSFDPHGNLYAAVSGDTTKIVAILHSSLVDAEAKRSEDTSIKSHLFSTSVTLQNINGVAFDTDGTLYISNGTTLAKMNPTTNQQIGPTYTSSLGNSSDLARSYGKN